MKSILTILMIGVISANAQIGSNLVSQQDSIQFLKSENDSLKNKVEEIRIFNYYMCEILSTMDLTYRNRFRVKVPQLAQKYRNYVEYYYPEVIKKARRRKF